VYVWGKTWIQAKTQAECYDYLFAAAVKMAQLGLDASRPPAPLLAAAANGARANGGSAAEAGGKRAAEAAAGGNAKRVRGGRRPPAAVVLDIEGTVAPISFVADTMFSYARQHVRGYLEGGFEGEEVQADVEAIRQQVGAGAVLFDLPEQPRVGRQGRWGVGQRPMVPVVAGGVCWSRSHRQRSSGGVRAAAIADHIAAQCECSTCM
jgi:methylthioribulose 1-phosphate dehydratase/enolase-phosphatase E1